MDVFVFGYPGSLGGADTELWHVLRLWRKHGLDVGVIPTWKANNEWRRQCDDLGLTTFQIEGPHEFEKVPKLAGATVVSFCNGVFLREAKFLRQLGCRLVWVNCMTWMFAAERRFYSEHGPFDAYAFQSEFQRSQLLPELKQFGVTDRQCFHVPGAFDPDEFPFAPRPHARDEIFTVGRLARPDVDKWSEETWEIYGAIPFSPVHARIMGWAPRIARKIGGPPPWAEVLRPCEETAQEFYASLHCLMAANGGARENWPRVGLEAMASGVPLVVDNAWG